MIGEGKMAATAEKEKQMNLAALQQRDPYISSISDSASQVAVYTFNANSNEWVRRCPCYSYLLIHRHFAPLKFHT